VNTLGTQKQKQKILLPPTLPSPNKVFVVEPSHWVHEIFSIFKTFLSPLLTWAKVLIDGFFNMLLTLHF
jgi:hypothetical protein